jgi:hypothetical protein
MATENLYTHSLIESEQTMATENLYTHSLIESEQTFLLKHLTRTFLTRH